MMKSSIRGVWALQFTHHEVRGPVFNICPTPALSLNLPTSTYFPYPFFPIQWICPTFSLVPERRLWSLSPFASFHEENEEGLYCPIMGHLQSWPRKTDFICLWGKREIPVTFQGGEEDRYPSL
ncbi:hypothetical protein A6R68_06510 [Neotoma lepida]|uniref:Uncharacterized protein n=1 Tax=Neotoma lepida TaxID=56216 RepID=A0A1A6GGN7_NEOLE|nr:hypothetical protein A6R68_06510 [Neotoma lepida]